jgi:CxxC motif-containing protein (DUF1111 family)
MERKKWTKRRVALHGLAALLLVGAPVVFAVTTEAPAGFDNLTNGFEPQANMDLDRASFDQVEQISDGLGPNYNAQSCRECHQNPVSGAISQITEERAGTTDGFSFFTPHPGGSLIFSRAIQADPSIQVRLVANDNVAAFRTSLNIAGDGFVEALPDSAFTNNQNYQAQFGLQGSIITVPVNESSGVTRIGRFGWKNQHASLLSFAADAYLNEMGITSPLQPTENTSNGQDVTFLNTQNGVPAIQDPPDANNPFGKDIGAFTRFMRSLKVPPRDATQTSSDARAGATLFSQIGCAVCHTATLTTAPAGTSFNGGKFIVPAALGSKNIHPYGDFMLHDVGTGDFIVQNGGIGTLTQVRTPPLWGMRTRNRLMHDGESLKRSDAINRHAGQANPIINNFLNLSFNQQNQIITFLNSL